MLTDDNSVGLATALNYDAGSEKFIAHYIHSSTGGGDITRVIFDSDFSVLSTESVLTGTHHRPHGLLLGDKFYLGYDTEGTSPTYSASISVYNVTRQ